MGRGKRVLERRRQKDTIQHRKICAKTKHLRSNQTNKGQDKMRQEEQEGTIGKRHAMSRRNENRQEEIRSLMFSLSILKPDVTSTETESTLRLVNLKVGHIEHAMLCHHCRH